MKIIKVDGGIGRVICATGALAKLAQTEETVAITSFPELFKGIGLKRVYNFNNQYLYEDVISNGKYIEPEPYNDWSYYADNQHLSSVFNKLINGVCEFVSPKIVLTKNELLDAKNMLGCKACDKKVILYQPWGAMGGYFVGDKKIENVKDDDSFRSLGTLFAKNLHAKMIAEGYTVYVIKTEQQVAFQDSLALPEQNIRKVISLIPNVYAVVGCDSFLHHASACFDTKTIVLWAGTSEKNLGYENQINFREKEFESEPLRLPHSPDYYQEKNKGCNEFSDAMIDKVMENL